MIDRPRRIVAQGLAAMTAAALASNRGMSSGRDRMSKRDSRPNFIVILTDDMGYGDLGCYGSKLIRTPHIDRLAREGVRFTDAYAAANLCTPSRAGLLTGRYPIRTGLANEVIQPSDDYGLPLTEKTIASCLQQSGYRTALIGKWHLGNRAPYWPASGYGFDRVFGLRGGNDDRPLNIADSVGDAQTNADPATLTEQFHQQSLAFIEANRNEPFFLYLAHTSPHLPLDPHPAFKGKSWAHAYGDVVEEVDDGVRRICKRLQSLGLSDRTMIIFTSDNGPWFEGDAGSLHGRKGSAGYDGGYRVPLIVRYPARVAAGRTTDAIAMGIDLLPTILHYAGVETPTDREIDGRSLDRVLEEGASSPHDELVLFDNAEVAGIRTQRWKLVRRFNYRVYAYEFSPSRPQYPPLFDMQTDPSERFNAAATYPTAWEEMKQRAALAAKRFESLKAIQQGKPVSGA